MRLESGGLKPPGSNGTQETLPAAAFSGRKARAAHAARVGVYTAGVNQGFEYVDFVGSNAAGETVLEYLVRRYLHSTGEEWAARIDNRRVLLDGEPTAADTPLRPRQKLVWLRPPWEEPQVPLCFAVLYRDEHLLAVAKPSGLPTVPGGGYLENTLLRLVRRAYPEANPLHRLGRGTSGVVLFARTSEASRRISGAWGGGEILKVYRALASGLIEPDEFQVEVPIGPVPHPLLGSVHAATPAGKPSSSHVKVLKRQARGTLVEVRISSGRPHQIRIHMAAAGHPLAGDPLYPAGGVPAEITAALPGDTGYLLHAERLGLAHPATGAWLEITCAPPPALRT